MKNVLSIFVLATLVFAFASCEKERGEAEACFDWGSAEFTAGKTIRFMNCSKNWDRSKWVVADSVMTPIFTEPTDTLKHFSYTFPAPGRYHVILYSIQGDTSSIADQTSEIIVTTP